MNPSIRAIDLPEPIQMLAFKRRDEYVRKNNGKTYAESHGVSDNGRLSTQFSWTLSPEGHEFWSAINKEDFRAYHRKYGYSTITIGDIVKRITTGEIVEMSFYMANRDYIFATKRERESFLSHREKKKSHSLTNKTTKKDELQKESFTERRGKRIGLDNRFGGEIISASISGQVSQYPSSSGRGEEIKRASLEGRRL